MIWWIAMTRADNLCLHLGNASNCFIKIVNFKPQEHTVPARKIRVADLTVMMRLLPSM